MKKTILGRSCRSDDSHGDNVDNNLGSARMRVLLILASLLTACETTWQVHQAPNQKPELTATRRVFTF